MSIDYNKFAPMQKTVLAGEYPSNDTVGQILKTLAEKFPRFVRYYEAGRSTENRPVHMAVITDFDVSADNKSHVVFSGAEHGQERNAAQVILETVSWLLSGDDEAAEILKHQKITVIPVVNADGYEYGSFANVNGVNLFADYSFDGTPTQAESKILAKVLNENMPELFVSVHGHLLDETRIRLTESTGIAFTTRTTRCFCRELVENVNKAAEAAGFPQDRGEEDSQRLLPLIPGVPEHSFEAFDREKCTSALWAYHKFHSLAMSMEVAYVASGVIRLKEFLRNGMKYWFGETVPTYPAWICSRANHLFLTSAGETLAQRRINRVKLWQNNVQTTMFANTPDLLGIFFGGAAFTFSMMRKLHEISPSPYKIAPSMMTLLELLQSEKCFDMELSERDRLFLAETSAAYNIEPCAIFRRDEVDGDIPDAVRLIFRLPQDAQLVDCRINGKKYNAGLHSYGAWQFINFDAEIKKEFPLINVFINYNFNK